MNANMPYVKQSCHTPERDNDPDDQMPKKRAKQPFEFDQLICKSNPLQTAKGTTGLVEQQINHKISTENRLLTTQREFIHLPIQLDNMVQQTRTVGDVCVIKRKLINLEDQEKEAKHMQHIITGSHSMNVKQLNNFSDVPLPDTRPVNIYNVLRNCSSAGEKYSDPGSRQKSSPISHQRAPPASGWIMLCGHRE
ncbi:hypothetical protein FGO68_gene4143 [Halteria grandinella]|uniref:Uncharacterized protein n=1 Tax=Halteria grandinella TaxID=5974 RepID=A0A8J8NCX4_HALGN|nr:hypothetical protein FGO68_gene4143 [Halteria grandinella]